MRSAPIVALGALLLAAGCGKKSVLKPADSAALPPKAATAARQPTVTQLLTVPTSAKPTRDDELVVKSRPLQPDRFDLPPPG